MISALLRPIFVITAKKHGSRWRFLFLQKRAITAIYWRHCFTAMTTRYAKHCCEFLSVKKAANPAFPPMFPKRYTAGKPQLDYNIFVNVIVNSRRFYNRVCFPEVLLYLTTAGMVLAFGAYTIGNPFLYCYFFHSVFSFFSRLRYSVTWFTCFSVCFGDNLPVPIPVNQHWYLFGSKYSTFFI